MICLSSWIRYRNPKLIIKNAIWKCPITVQMSEMYLNELIKRIFTKHKWLHIVRNVVYYITGCFGELHVNVYQVYGCTYTCVHTQMLFNLLSILLNLEKVIFFYIMKWYIQPCYWQVSYFITIIFMIIYVPSELNVHMILLMYQVG